MKSNPWGMGRHRSPHEARRDAQENTDPCTTGWQEKIAARETIW
jgi:hypothetical protein